MTPHEVLGVKPTATHTEIRDAYRRLARLHHPDKGGDASRFHEVRKAYESLTKGKCAQCGGTGTVVTRRGFFVDRTPCPTCWKLK